MALHVDGLRDAADVERRAARSAHLIDQLLSLAQAEAGESGMPSSRRDLAEALIERMLPDARGRRVASGSSAAAARWWCWPTRC